MRGLAAACVALAMLALAGCAIPKAPADVEAAADLAIQQASSGDVAGLQKSGGPELQGPEVAAQLDRIRAEIPKTPYTKAETVQWRISVATGAPIQAEIARDYSYPGQVAHWEIVLSRDSDQKPWTLRGLHVQRISQAQVKAAGFSLANRTPLHYAVFFGMIASVLLCLFAFIRVITAPKFPWKWAFAILSLLAFTQFSLNWGTGEWGFQPINISLLGAAFLKGPSPLDPWVLSVGVPIGALIGLWRAGKARRDKAAATRAAF
ncbi:hypothetical protein QO010_004481 [Caulobacter ginsengisoli]|uniref:Lipoprotein n=1 Tax=Caulobacter ginsengisoli TaxID=400775 RepID=A0ABU0IXG9_9CAUL|nr:hypothetical protein [Caulobacter ginsengisoli]MDQ0466685.1 hypothetical protein [Caulobacter ginsengisoli]